MQETAKGRVDNTLDLPRKKMKRERARLRAKARARERARTRKWSRAEARARTRDDGGRRTLFLHKGKDKGGGEGKDSW